MKNTIVDGGRNKILFATTKFTPSNNKLVFTRFRYYSIARPKSKQWDSSIDIINRIKVIFAK